MSNILGPGLYSSCISECNTGAQSLYFHISAINDIYTRAKQCDTATSSQDEFSKAEFYIIIKWRIVLEIYTLPI